MASHAHLPLADLSVRRVRSAGDVRSPHPRPSRPTDIPPPSTPPLIHPSIDRNPHLLNDLSYFVASSQTNQQDIPLIEPPIRHTPTNNDSNRPRPTGALARCLAFFGYGPGNRARKELVSLIWNIFFCIIQVCPSFLVVFVSHYYSVLCIGHRHRLVHRLLNRPQKPNYGSPIRVEGL